ncbi:MAG: DUF86 domain-containing protein [Candidatus Methanomarinus sp.]|uniref:DUF86 domain-containing protein n=1 Tax=Candidatus Methanomarinus sp. TaxID=3386244 RepID=A0AC61SBU7_9EURY|nr:MAG: putative conserved protein YutE, UPF0331/DUF86 family [ANME-2 cluster archaeon]KAF5425147.1 hypothetical protein C5S42_11430 [ANME-2 cluster archaeon]TKY92194.1 MAG: DUF86 domain-containing protein [ANME-2 cluster archaeon]
MNSDAINPNLVAVKISEIKQSLKRMDETSSKGRDAFLTDPDLMDSSKYRLITAIEAAISICNHIIARGFNRVPESYSDCFIILHESGVISALLAKKLGNMARFRNMLVHIYWEIDDDKIFDILTDDIADLDDYIREIVRFLE